MKLVILLFSTAFCFTSSLRATELKAANELPLPASVRNQSTMIKLATVKLEENRAFLPLKKGEKLYVNGSYVWKKIPQEFEGFRFAQAQNKHGAFTNFTVESEGYVYMAVTSRWMLEDNEKSREGLISRRVMVREGWKPLDKTGILVSDEVGYEWNVFVRACKAGEKISLRTDKYCPPVLLLK